MRGEEQRIGRRFAPNAGQRKGSKDQSLAEKSELPVRRPEESPERQSAYTNRNAKRFRKQGGGPKGSTIIKGTPQSSISYKQKKGQMVKTILSRVKNPQTGTVSHRKCIKHGQNSHGVYQKQKKKG
ncbi:hypothetical protein O181_073450 [Austropuccinia psidii MF-1]|uniref:Uncharacterized protein n=1 Tax=Austropuccinia psidii MF-1 TaxID=1389203 RepID=A0A9Q3FAK1_9BASI|nr:hypothetical protein [Austropuccinia psidii MF-1]